MKILVVDDKLSVQETLTNLLCQHGHQVDVSANGLDAFEKAQKNDYQLYIIDHLMPLMNGVQLVKNLKQTEHCATTSVLFMTTQGISEAESLPEYSLFSDVIAKPLNNEELLQKLYSLGAVSSPKELTIIAS